ncbi:hypothetical protein GCM10011354_19730 [Egicoccus halophilus]|uniref:SLH domain-containing protein n=1 Tax=Egicoccus halophilus TaxID=1670830 RepID=A0A8J3A8G2_9ACTN|nr:hypothetical protein GCM10011354_19730 [Egicoccus halophilus]
MLGTGLASADGHTFDRGIDAACTGTAQQPGTFTDTGGAVHEPAIECLARWEIAQGYVVDDGQRAYAPGNPVNRAAMASFVARAMQTGPYALPTDPEPAFDDVAGTHADNVDALARSGSYRAAPTAPTARANR